MAISYTSTPQRRPLVRFFSNCSTRSELPIDHAMAENLFVAISTDTGSFQYPNTTARTYEIGAELVRVGVERRTRSARKCTRVIRAAGSSYCARCSARCVSTPTEGRELRSKPATAAELGVKPEDNEGLIDHIRAIEGVIVAAFFEELPDGKVRVSLRSKSEESMCAQSAGSSAAAATPCRRRARGAVDACTRLARIVKHSKSPLVLDSPTLTHALTATP